MGLGEGVVEGVPGPGEELGITSPSSPFSHATVMTPTRATAHMRPTTRLRLIPTIFPLGAGVRWFCGQQTACIAVS